MVDHKALVRVEDVAGVYAPMFLVERDLRGLYPDVGLRIAEVVGIHLCDGIDDAVDVFLQTALVVPEE